MKKQVVKRIARKKTTFFELTIAYKQNVRISALADMAELVDALDLGSSAARRGGSTPSIRT